MLDGCDAVTSPQSHVPTHPGVKQGSDLNDPTNQETLETYTSAPWWDLTSFCSVAKFDMKNLTS